MATTNKVMAHSGFFRGGKAIIVNDTNFKPLMDEPTTVGDVWSRLNIPVRVTKEGRIYKRDIKKVELVASMSRY